MVELSERLRTHFQKDDRDGLSPFHHGYARTSRAAVEVFALVVSLDDAHQMDAAMHRLRFLIKAAIIDPVAYEAAKKLAASLLGLRRDLPDDLADFARDLLEDRIPQPRPRPAPEGLFWHRDRLIWKAVKIAMHALGPRSKGRAVQAVCDALEKLNYSDRTVKRPQSKRAVEEIYRRQEQEEVARGAKLQANRQLIEAHNARQK